ncbi:MAG: GrpB family protein [Verrucomicrobia bacterium]|nr:GrpB family protein [Verrucomicrobiota bacterium]
MRIRPYFSNPAEFHAYEPEVIEIARRLRSGIQGVEPALQVEHVGSTSVPGCGGKGIIDLAVLYPEGLLARARVVLDELGFQKQGGPEPFPEDRPMRVGCVEDDGRLYRIHAHVIALGSEEHDELAWFREALRRDSTLKQSYEERKRAILAAGIQDELEYCKAKGAFVTDALKSVSENCAGSCGEGFWLWPRRRGPSIPNAGCKDRANAGHGQKTRRPEGFRAKGRLASLLLSRRSREDILLRRASPSGLWRENRTPRNFRTRSKERQPAEPTAAPNGGPATRFGHSEATEGRHR